MLTDEERFALVLVKRKELEAELREAEILLGLIKTNLARADVLFRQFELAFEERMKGEDKEKVRVRRITPEMDQAIEDLWKRKVPVPRIARDLNIVDTTVKRRLRAMGVVFRSKFRKRVTQELVREFGEKFKSGESINRIAKQSGVSATTVSKHLKKLGFDVETRQMKKLRVIK